MKGTTNLQLLSVLCLPPLCAQVNHGCHFLNSETLLSFFSIWTFRKTTCTAPPPLRNLHFPGGGKMIVPSPSQAQRWQ